MPAQTRHAERSESTHRTTIPQGSFHEPFRRQLIQSAQDHWRSVNAPHLVALAHAGAVFSNGVLIERPEQAAAWLASHCGRPPPPTASSASSCTRPPWVDYVTQIWGWDEQA